MKRVVFFSFLLCLLALGWAAAAADVSFTGSFAGQFMGDSSSGRLTLVLRQEQTNVSGNLALELNNDIIQTFSIRGTVTADGNVSAVGLALDGSGASVMLNASASISNGQLSLSGTVTVSDGLTGNFNLSQLVQLDPIDLTGSFSGALMTAVGGSRAAITLNVRQTGDQITGNIQVQTETELITINAEVSGTVRADQTVNLQLSVSTPLGPVRIGSVSAFFTSDGAIISGTLTVNSPVVDLQGNFVVRGTS